MRYITLMFLVYNLLYSIFNVYFKMPLYTRFFNDYSFKNLQAVFIQTGLQSHQSFSDITGVPLQTIRQWFSTNPKSKSKRSPSIQAWNNLLLSLDAHYLGYKTPADLISAAKQSQALIRAKRTSEKKLENLGFKNLDELILAYQNTLEKNIH